MLTTTNIHLLRVGRLSNVRLFLNVAADKQGAGQMTLSEPLGILLLLVRNFDHLSNFHLLADI